MAKKRPKFSSLTEMEQFFKETGKVGGKRSLVTMTPEERTARAKKAAAAASKARIKKAAMKRKAAAEKPKRSP